MMKMTTEEKVEGSGVDSTNVQAGDNLGRADTRHRDEDYCW